MLPGGNHSTLLLVAERNQSTGDYLQMATKTSPARTVSEVKPEPSPESAHEDDQSGSPAWPEGPQDAGADSAAAADASEAAAPAEGETTVKTEADEEKEEQLEERKRPVQKKPAAAPQAAKEES